MSETCELFHRINFEKNKSCSDSDIRLNLDTTRSNTTSVFLLPLGRVDCPLWIISVVATCERRKIDLIHSQKAFIFTEFSLSFRTDRLVNDILGILPYRFK